jgi:hypothetical protein
MNILRGKPRPPAAEPVGGGTLSRRRVLGGLAAVPVLVGIGSATPALATTTAQPGSDLVRGVERRYHAPLLTAGTRLLLPAGIKSVSIQDYYHRPHLASAESAWPRVIAADGTTVDASTVPERGAATRIAILSGFAEGWYELSHASGRTDRVTWDARKLPFLWFYGEFGATNEAPFHDRFYTLALQPLSRVPYPVGV